MAQGAKNLPASAGGTGDAGSIPELERPSGGGYGSPLQYSCPDNPIDRGVWQATVHGVAKSWTRLSRQARVVYEMFPGALFYLLDNSVRWILVP